MIGKRDGLIIFLALLLAGGAYLGLAIHREGLKLSGMVEIRVNGELFAKVPLGEVRDIPIRQENGEENTVGITESGAYMKASSCKNQLCLHQGEVTERNWTARAMGRTIVCLPNRVLVELAIEGAGERIAREDLPDV